MNKVQGGKPKNFKKGNKPNKGDKPKDNHPPKRNFFTIFSSRVYGASKAANCPQHIEGFVFFKSDAQSLDPKNPERALHYNAPRLGSAVVLTQEQMDYICQYLGLTTTGLESKDQPEADPEQ